MSVIAKVKMKNFKRFSNHEIIVNPTLNIFVGDNESGKSTILAAINLVLCGSISKVEAGGLESLFNTDAINDFLAGDMSYDSLPILQVELYLNEQNNIKLYGSYNSEDEVCDGLLLRCIPNEEFSVQIVEVLAEQNIAFPFEYYSIQFKTFAGQSYAPFNKFLNHIFIDNTQISGDYAIREYVNNMYNHLATGIEKNKHSNEYRRLKNTYKCSTLQDLNARSGNYTFALKSTTKNNVDTDLTIYEGDIAIDNRGKGRQCFIKTEFALNQPQRNIDVILLEEPENHLSQLNMKKLISRIIESNDKQLFIATHSNMICTGLDLRMLHLLNSSGSTISRTQELTKETSDFFMKAPNNNVLQFVLSKKIILVEGSAEYILMEHFYNSHTAGFPNNDDVHIISVGGLSFKRYLEIAKILNIKTAVITDNDRDYQSNCSDKYKGYIQDNLINVFSDVDNENYTFEVCLYKSNTDLYNTVFLGKTLPDYLLKNKAESAFKILTRDEGLPELAIPQYIKDAIEWIKS